LWHNPQGSYDDLLPQERNFMRAASVILLLLASMLLGAALGYAFVGAGFVASEFGATPSGDASGT
jgi:hypothetical protein